MTLDLDALDAIARGAHGDPFAIFGMHELDGHLEVRCFQPHADRAGVIDARSGTEVAQLAKIHPAGFFSGTVPSRTRFPYRLALGNAGGSWTVDDPYRFPLVLSDYDIYLLAEGTHHRSYEQLGAHPRVIDGVDGVAFAVWAPNARRVAVGAARDRIERVEIQGHGCAPVIREVRPPTGIATQSGRWRVS